MKMDYILKRRANILYRLRKKKLHANTRQRIVYYTGDNPRSILQIRQLMDEYKFNVQFEIK